jgi:hypothetical protein
VADQQACMKGASDVATSGIARPFQTSPSGPIDEQQPVAGVSL